MSILRNLRTDNPSRALRWSILGFGIGLALFSVITQPFMSNEPLSRAFYIGTSLWLVTSGLLWISLSWAAVSGLAAAVGVRVLLDFRLVEQDLFIIVMVGVLSAYAKPLCRITYCALTLLWLLPGFLMMADRELAVLSTLGITLLVLLAYLFGTVARRLRRDRDRSQKELSRVNTSQEEQRAILARELHDNAISDLTSIVMKAQRLQLSHQDADLKYELEAVLDRANLTIDRIGRIVSLLRTNEPITGEDPLALPSIVEGLQEFQEELHSTGIITTVESTNGVTSLGPSAQIAMHHILKEAVTNVIKYGAPTAGDEPTCHIRFAVEDERAELRVDNIIDTSRQLSSPTIGVGLEVLRERAEAQGADVSAGLSDTNTWRLHVTNMRTV